MSAITKARQFLSRNKEQLQQEVNEIDSQIAELQKVKVSINSFLKLFEAVNGSDDTVHPQSLQQQACNQTSLKPVGGNPDKVTPLGEKGLSIAKQLALREQFDVHNIWELVRVHDVTVTKTFCYTWLAAWKGKSWIETLSSGIYKFNEAFKLRCNEQTN